MWRYCTDIFDYLRCAGLPRAGLFLRSFCDVIATDRAKSRRVCWLAANGAVEGRRSFILHRLWSERVTKCAVSGGAVLVLMRQPKGEEGRRIEFIECCHFVALVELRTEW